MTPQTLKLIRQTLGISQRQLAIQAGVSNGLISFIESGQKPLTPSVASRLLSVLGVTDEQRTRYDQIARELRSI